jgi:Fatty acid desaturase
MAGAMQIGATLDARPRSILRHSRWDAILVAMSVAHAAALLAIPSMPLVAVALWWNANTIAHNFIHRPFFRSRMANAGYSIFLSAVQGIPQTLWRHRHLAHHAGRHRRFRWSVPFAIELAAIAAVWTIAFVVARATFLGSYLPGYALGLVLCYLQGHFEHAHGGTISHYGRIYNLVFFNDGYHVEHHRRPSDHWTELPGHTVDGGERSSWPPVLRWLDDVRPRVLDLLEHAVLRSPRLQQFVVAAHERAIRALLERAPQPARVIIVGGGLFPRTAIILRRLLPDASLVVVEEKAAHIETARRFLDDRVAFHHEIYDPRRSPTDADLVIVPLAYDGNRNALYAQAPAPRLLVHDWLWHRKGRGMAVSWLLLKRVNLVTR